jgi:3-hydroxyisobutyrate dehydrogenase-like beta-hydroxyacid dehydrogenase
MTMEVGFIGLGTMGAPMAANLRKAGHGLVVHDVRRVSAEPLIAAGAVWADTPQQVARGAEVVFTSLPGPVDVEAVALGPDGLLAGMRPNGAYFDVSTNSPTVVRRISAAFSERGAHMLDAPISGGPKGAASGKLALWVGGDKAVFDRYKPVLDAMGDQAYYCGSVGAGSVAKLVHNLAGACIQASLAEVFTMGVKAGLDPLALFEAVEHGVVGRRRTFDGLIDVMADKFDPPAFALRLQHKDISLATALGRELGVPMRMSSLAMDELTEALGRGWGERNFTVAALLQQQRAGVSLAVNAEDLERLRKTRAS